MAKSAALPAIALALAFCLCAELTILGIDKFYYIQAGGAKFATFPHLAAQLRIGGLYSLLQLMYFGWLWQVPKMRWVTSWNDCLRQSAPFILLGFLAYPLGNDGYLYLHSGLMNLAGVNPFITPAAAFVSRLSPFVDWGQTSTYGPVSQLLFSMAAIAVPIHPLLGIYLFKGLCVGLHLLNGYLVWQLHDSEEHKWWAIAYLVNPLLLMEQVGSGHVDVLISSSFLLLASLLRSQHYALVFVVVWAGFLAKTLPILWLPLVMVFLIRQRCWSQCLVGLGLSCLLLADLALTVLPTLEAWRSLLNPGVVGQSRASLHELIQFSVDVIQGVMAHPLSLAEERSLLERVSQYLTGSYLLIYIWFLLHSLMQPTYKLPHLLSDIGWVTLILFLGATPWVMPWYASGMIAIAIVSPCDRLRRASFAYSFTSALQYLLQGFPGLNSLIVIGVPVLVLLLRPRPSTA